jgi:trimeric autotransporter adhesin
MPFIRAESVPNAMQAAVSPLYVMAPDGVQVGQFGEFGTGGSTYLLGGLLIDGQGPDQTSAAVLLVGRVFQNEPGVPRAWTSHRGSYRTDSAGGSFILTGIVKSLESDGAHVFGPLGNNFVLSAGFDEAGDIFFDRPARFEEMPLQDRAYSTTHVADLTDVTSQSGLTRSTRTYTGYAAGMQEIGGTTSLIPYRSETNSLVLRFDAERDTIGGTFTLSDVTDQDVIDHYRVNFGHQPGVGGTGHGTYVDDDRYGARQALILDTVVLDDETVLQVHPTDFPKTYFFGNELAPQPAFFAGAGVTPCECKFLEWGYWGTLVRWRAESEEFFRPDFFHLGTWVAGDISREAALDTSGGATYHGHAVGNVARDFNGTTHQYLAAGQFQLNWDFGSRTGSAQINNFDGMNFSSGQGGLASATSPGSQEFNRFTGGLSDGNGISGGLSGSFVRGPLDDPAQGVIGNFDLSGSGFSATGIVAGQKTVIVD